MAYIGKSPAVAALTASDITDGIISTAKLADDGVTEAKMANDAISLTELKAGTDGQIISWDSSGNPVAIAVGTAGHFLKSAGAGAQPAFASAGITEADMWRITSGYTGNTEPITANWERADTDSFTVLGTGLSNSSGIFTFPSTGYYFIDFQASFTRNGDKRGVGCNINVTTNNSSYSDTCASATFVQQTESDATSAFAKTSAIVDVTDTANVKVHFGAGATDVSVNGNSNANQTGFICIKLADT